MDKKIAVYARVAYKNIENGKDLSISMEKQLNEINKFVKTKNMNVWKYYIDDGYSGINFDRPAFRQLKQDIEDGIIDTIIVKDFTRIFRNYFLLQFMNNFPKVRIISIEDNYDSKEQNEEYNNSIEKILQELKKCSSKDVHKIGKSKDRIC